ncbi:MAG: class I SAM-dependent RNA methyltransferase, partial [Bacillota bacterium]
MADGQPVSLGEEVIIELDDLAYGGDAVGRKDGFAIFVPQGVPGDRVQIEIIELKQNYGRGQIIEVLESGAERIESKCQISLECGGCQLQQIDYQAELEYKRDMVADNLERIGDLEVEVQPVIPMEHPYFYRNKAQFPVGLNSEDEVVTGFYAAGTHQIIDTRDCMIQHQLINRIVRETIDLIDKYEIPIYDEEDQS